MKSFKRAVEIVDSLRNEGYEIYAREHQEFYTIIRLYHFRNGNYVNVYVHSNVVILYKNGRCIKTEVVSGSEEPETIVYTLHFNEENLSQNHTLF